MVESELASGDRLLRGEVVEDLFKLRCRLDSELHPVVVIVADLDSDLFLGVDGFNVLDLGLVLVVVRVLVRH